MMERLNTLKDAASRMGKKEYLEQATVEVNVGLSAGTSAPVEGNKYRILHLIDPKLSARSEFEKFQVDGRYCKNKSLGRKISRIQEYMLEIGDTTTKVLEFSTYNNH